MSKFGSIAEAEGASVNGACCKTKSKKRVGGNRAKRAGDTVQENPAIIEIGAGQLPNDIGKAAPSSTSVVIANAAGGLEPLNKKAKRLEKLMRQIVELEDKVGKGLTPSNDQLFKLSRRAEVELQLAAMCTISAIAPLPEVTMPGVHPTLAQVAEPSGPERTVVNRSVKTKGSKRKAQAANLEVLDNVNRTMGESSTSVTPAAVTFGDVKPAALIAEVEAPTEKVLGTAEFRKFHQIIVNGTCPAPFETFSAAESELGEPLIKALRLQGYDAPTPIQAQAWPLALRGVDMVGVAKTGSGKTCGFLLPALARIRQRGPMPKPEISEPTSPTVLVLSPTRELAQQIAGEADKFAPVASAKVVTLYGGVPRGDQIRQLCSGADIIIACPGRLFDFSEGNPTRHPGRSVSLEKVSYLVLDEADQMLDMGFEPEIRKIVAQCPAPGRPEQGGGAAGPSAGSARQTLFFTATWPIAVQGAARSLTSNAVHLRIGQGAGGDKLTVNTSVTQKVLVVEERQKFLRLQEILQTELGLGETAFIFAKTKLTCNYLEQKLWDEKEELSIGTWCRALHSGKEQWVREEILSTFRQLATGKDNGRKGILVATDVAARGLDIPGVALVVVYDFGGGSLGQDSGVESYVHRIGRTGRAGKTGKAFTFFTEHDSGAAKLVELLDGAKQRVPYELRHLAEKDSQRRGAQGGKKGGGKVAKVVKSGNGGKSGKGGKVVKGRQRR